MIKKVKRSSIVFVFVVIFYLCGVVAIKLSTTAMFPSIALSLLFLPSIQLLSLVSIDT
ncbi:hypothetical protein EDC01DRAFT_639479 [Geopyxis carbonaria]|nr:hypothetical protein EDC01DRAFT_639479 [Geopyxis carbonaria]